MIVWLIYVIIIILLAEDGLNKNDSEYLKYGLIILRDEYENSWYICYNRQTQQSESKDNTTDNMSKVETKGNPCTNTDWKHGDCVKSAIYSCGWESNKLHEIAVTFIYTLKYRYGYSENAFKTILKTTAQDIAPIGNFNFVPYKQVSINEKTSALFELCQLFYDPNMAQLKKTSFINFSQSSLSVGIFEIESNSRYDWMKKKFILQGKQYKALLQKFYCLAAYNIMQTAAVILASDNGSNEDITTHPCLSDGFQNTFVLFDGYNNVCVSKFTPPTSKKFVGEYNFDKCVKLISAVFDYPGLCGKNTPCNFSTLNEGILIEQPEKIVFYNDYFTFPEQTKSGLIQTLLDNKVDYCLVVSSMNIAEKSVKNDRCYQLHIIYALLKHNFFLHDSIVVSIRNRVNFIENMNWVYLFTDPLYGSILSEEEIVSKEQLEFEETVGFPLNKNVLSTTQQLTPTSSILAVDGSKDTILKFKVPIRKYITFKITTGLMASFIVITFIASILMCIKFYYWKNRLSTTQNPNNRVLNLL